MSDHDRPDMIPAPVDSSGTTEPTVPAVQPAHAATRPSVTRPFVRPVRASVLSSRAIAAARARAAVATPHSSDRTWLDRAGRAVRILAGTLGVDPAAVLARPDPDRRQGLLGAPGVLLYVITDDTAGPRDGSAGFQGELLFIPDEGRSDVFLQLMPCSDCGRFVPTYVVTSLADLGLHLDSESPRWAREPDVRQFHTDPAHRPRCRRRHQTHPSSRDYR
jgi:hypothetical protein